MGERVGGSVGHVNAILLGTIDESSFLMKRKCGTREFSGKRFLAGWVRVSGSVGRWVSGSV